ncbi:MAG: serine hydrolase [Anaerolineae bacterium]|nr:serine hydrolase [Anaerolineae bacterium]
MASSNQLKRTRPEAEGIPSSAILDFINAVEQHTHPLDALHGFMLLRHGNVVAEGWWEPYGPRTPHWLYSLSKSFTSSAIGLAVSEGLLTVNDPVLKFFPDVAPENPSDNLKAMRVRHLLSMNTGHQEDTTSKVFWGEDDNWARAFLSLPVENEPGTWFVYNTAATYMLSAIITKLTGQPLLDYLTPRLFEPLGIENPAWDVDPQGINLGGTGLHITTEDITHFGQMYLQKGMWNGKRILTEEWIDEATRATSDNSNREAGPDWIQGYGYQFWRCRHNCYRGDGAFGQYCLIMPEQDAVVAINSGVRDLQAVLDKIWEHLLPAMQADALPDNPDAHDKLAKKLASLSLPMPQGEQTSPQAKAVDGKIYSMAPNDLKLKSVAMAFGDESSTLTIGTETGEQTVPIGYQTWHKGTAILREYGEEAVAASGAWTDANTYTVHLCFYESEVGPIFTFHYDGDDLQLGYEPNVSWMPTDVMTIMGHATD